MGVSKYNSEGYYDPTAYEALAKITQEEKAARYRPLVYICSPYLSEETERELAIFMDLVLLGKCEQLWVFGGEVSDGMRREIGKAKQKNMTIRYFTEDMEETECR